MSWPPVSTPRARSSANGATASSTNDYPALRKSLEAFPSSVVVDGPSASQPAGAYEVFWNGLDREGRPAASGIYYYRLESPTKSQTRKMTLIK